MLDGTLIPIERVAADRPYYSGKHKKHGMNVQVIAAPDGTPLLTSGSLPGSVHDLTAARIWGPGRSCPRGMRRLTSSMRTRRRNPLHVVRFGTQIDVQGVLAGSKDADQCIRYLSKYLTKSIGDTLDSENQAQRLHAERLADALRFEPCSPTCPNWLRYGVQPKSARAGMAPGRCRGKGHKPEHLGYAGRRVLASRKWSNKTLAEHKQDRRTWVLEALGVADEPVDPHRYSWRPVPHGDANVPPLALRLLRSVHERQRWRNHMNQLRAQADGHELSATEGSAA